MATVLVTGAAGFIGSHVAQVLMARGDSVVGIDNLNDYYDVTLKQARLARLTAQKIREVRDYLEVPVVVENVSSYAEFHVSEMTEWEFLNEVVGRADCGILLDVNNIYVSSQNHNFNPLDYLNAVPHDRVAQIHIAGHSKYRKYILDTHDHPVIDPVWKLYDRAIQCVGHTATLLEWDDRIPPFEEVHNEALKANKYLASASLAAAV